VKILTKIVSENVFLKHSENVYMEIERDEDGVVEYYMMIKIILMIEIIK
jgi:hypothetical protein